MNTSSITIAPGRYVLAVSGGVDSMVLLNLLLQFTEVKLTIAHFDHGIRGDSHEDRRLVQSAAAFYGLPFVYHEGGLGTGTSEATARKARYEFLRKVQIAADAQAIITAHHQDDLLETAILNMLRGTNRRGLSSLQSRPNIIRPLLHVSKAEILDHARSHDLIWREDSTNQDIKFRRNYVRQQIIPRLDTTARARLLAIIADNLRINQELDQELINQLHYQHRAHTLNKSWFASLPHTVAREVMATWLREHGLTSFDKRTLERLTVMAKTQAVGQRINIFQKHWMDIKSDHLALTTAER
jgi:tRNA(Ile)-lysidine synthetase-like protein